MDEKIKFIVDSAADIAKDLLLKYDIEVINCPVCLGDRDIAAYEFATNQEFYDTVSKSPARLSTAQPSPVLIEEVLRKFASDYDCVIFVTLSSAGSGLYESAVAIAHKITMEVNCCIEIIDSRAYSMAIGMYLLNAARMYRKGKSKNQIVDYLNECYSKVGIYFMLDDLKHLKAGGRIKPTEAMFCAALNIKLICCLEDGLIKLCGKERGYKRAMKRLLEFTNEDIEKGDDQNMCVVHSGEIEKAENFALQAKNWFEVKDVAICEIGPVVTAHAGLGVIGVIFLKKKVKNL